MLERLTDEIASDDMKKKVKTYLTMSLIGKTFKLLNRSREVKDVWDALEEEFASTEDVDCYELEEEFKQCEMVDQYGNPADWLNQLDKINTRIGNIYQNRLQYQTSDSHESPRERIQSGYHVIQELLINDIK